MLDVSVSHIRRLEFRQGQLRLALEDVADQHDPVLLMVRGAQIADVADAFIAAALPLLRSAGALGASLSMPRFRSGTRVPVMPIEDGYDVIFAQSLPDVAVLFVPEGARALLTAWILPGHAGYQSAMKELDEYFVLPRTPLAYLPGFESNHRRDLAVGRRDWCIPQAMASLALYDASWNPAPSAVRRLGPLSQFPEFDVDLWGESALSDGAGLLLSSRPCNAPLMQFPLSFTPLEANLTQAVDHGFFSLGRASDFGGLSTQARERLFRHVTRYNALDDYFGQFLSSLRHKLAGSGQ